MGKALQKPWAPVCNPCPSTPVGFLLSHCVYVKNDLYIRIELVLLVGVWHGI